ncbi:hypothetical protein QPX56_09975 [Corynebacterium pseudodiphtheriticum]|uniref:hypothetical protein n=1 Tax=Corynebacterium pseudodiphtheriticum TaxID=37637 RepID=UPI0025430F73|nr:hypothetical protein [Corynebacterium pseudodiphtheriticum]MDK4329093.1 hypothetical protein [Corynebacterium pseudodiphtheriticum]
MRVLHVDPDISDTATFRHFPLFFHYFPGLILLPQRAFNLVRGQYPNRWWSLDLFHQLEPDGDDTGGDAVDPENL